MSCIEIISFYMNSGRNFKSFSRAGTYHLIYRNKRKSWRRTKSHLLPGWRDRRFDYHVLCQRLFRDWRCVAGFLPGRFSAELSSQLQKIRHHRKWLFILSLSNQNFRKIACVIENPDTLVGQSYIKAYEDALNAIGQPIEKNMMIEIDDFTSMNPTKIFSQIIACGAEAVFCTSSALTVSLSDCLIYYNHKLYKKL